MTSSIGMRKQQQNSTVLVGFGLFILLGCCCCCFPPCLPPFLPPPPTPPGPCCFTSCCGFEAWDFCCSAIRPRRSAKVSRLVLSSSRMGVFDARGPGLDRADRLACSLCCQQYRVSSPGSSTRRFPAFVGVDTGEGFDAATGRRHGLPLDVIPLHVVDGFLESDRLMRDSGVFAKKGIIGMTQFARTMYETAQTGETGQGITEQEERFGNWD